MDSSEGKTNGSDIKLTSETSEEVFGQVISLTDCNELSKNEEMSQDFHEPSIFSQETPEFDMQSTEVINAVSSENSGKSSDVTAVVPTMDLVILETETDSTSEKGSVISLSDSGDGIKNDHNSLIRRKSSQMSPVPYKKTCLEDSRHSESTTNIENSSNITEDALKLKSTAPLHTPVAIRSSPRNSPQKNINRHQLLQPARRLKKSVSVDNDIETRVKILSSSPSIDLVTPTSAKKISKLTLRRKRALSVDVKHSHSDILPEKYSQDELQEYFGCKTAKTPNVDDELLSGRKNPIQPIIEESQNDICYQNIDDTQNVVPLDSQNIQLFLSPTIETSCLLSADALENEPLLSQDVSDTPVDVVLLSDSNRAPTDISNNDSHKSPQSLNLDSPFNSDNSKKPIIKAKPYLSNGYSSSTPENAPENVLLKKSFHLSDSETDNTPPFTNFSKQPDSQLSNSSKSNCSTINSSISPLNNGLMNGSHVSNSSQPSVPIFHIQMYGDENDDFLSMFIVKTSNDMGAQTLREYQRLSKRLSTDAYAGDVSKTTSPSSITSGGLLQLPPHPRSSFMSTTSSSSTSSSRTSDGAFIIPQRPKRNFSFHSPTTVKGWLALRQTLSDIVSKLADLDPTEEVMRSPVNGEAKSSQIFSANNSRSPENKKDDMYSGKNTSNEYSRSTPKSSKKKIQTKTKRVLSKIKKTELSVTNEESQEMIESISSPEIVPTEKCEEFQTPSRLQKSNIETSGTPKTTPRGRKPKNNSLLVTPVDNPFPLSHQEQTYPRGTLVLAKWRDKKYYSGRVLASTDNNKYEIEFYDGQMKTLLDDFIIFGNMTELPLKGQSVYTKVDDATYEPSLVLAVEKNENGEVLYKCTTDRDSMVAVKASDIYLTEDQAKSFQETIPPKSPHSAPGTPRRRINRDLDLNNILHEPRSARLRDKTTPKLLGSPSSPKAGPSSIRKGPSKRLESESSEGGDSRASSTAPEDVDGLQPETQTTPRKTKGIKVNYVARNLIAIKGNSKQKTGKESKVKFETEEEITETLGPIPPNGSTLFSGLHFLLSCTDMPPLKVTTKTTSPFTGSDSYQDSSGKEDEIMLAKIPFMKQRLEQQLEKGGGTVYSRFEDIPKNKYSSCRLIVSRPCQTGKFIMCLAANIKSLSHLWVIQCCKFMKILDYDSYALPTGFSIERERMISSHERSCTKPFKDKLVLICCDNENFTKFWDRVCCLAGANTKILTEDDMDVRNAIAIITESNCPTIIRNKAEYERIPLVSTTWIVQCLIEGKLLNCNGNIRYRFDYIDE